MMSTAARSLLLCVLCALLAGAAAGGRWGTKEKEKRLAAEARQKAERLAASPNTLGADAEAAEAKRHAASPGAELYRVQCKTKATCIAACQKQATSTRNQKPGQEGVTHAAPAWVASCGRATCLADKNLCHLASATSTPKPSKSKSKSKSKPASRRGRRLGGAKQSQHKKWEARKRQQRKRRKHDNREWQTEMWREHHPDAPAGAGPHRHTAHNGAMGANGRRTAISCERLKSSKQCRNARGCYLDSNNTCTLGGCRHSYTWDLNRTCGFVLHHRNTHLLSEAQKKTKANMSAQCRVYCTELLKKGSNLEKPNARHTEQVRRVSIQRLSACHVGSLYLNLMPYVLKLCDAVVIKPTSLAAVGLGSFAGPQLANVSGSGLDSYFSTLACEGVLDSPDLPANANVSACEGTLKQGQACHFGCNEGYRLEAPNGSYTQADDRLTCHYGYLSYRVSCERLPSSLSYPRGGDDDDNSTLLREAAAGSGTHGAVKKAASNFLSAFEDDSTLQLAAAGVALGLLLLCCCSCVHCRRQRSKVAARLDKSLLTLSQYETNIQEMEDYKTPLEELDELGFEPGTQLEVNDDNQAELQLGEEVGRGSFGVVFRAGWRGRDVAVKRLVIRKSDLENMKEIISDFVGEVKVCLPLKHTNIVECLGYVKKPKLCIISELMPNGSLYDYMSGASWPGSLCKEQQLSMATDVAQGMKYLHAKSLIHRDLKSPNLLISHDWRLKISDFGMSRTKDLNEMGNTVLMTQAGTPYWTAPEVLRGETYNEKADVFSFAMCIYEIMTGKIPWSVSLVEVGYMVAHEGKRPVLPLDIVCSATLQQIMEQCWAQEASQRPSFEEVVRRLHAHAKATRTGLPYTVDPALAMRESIELTANPLAMSMRGSQLLQ